MTDAECAGTIAEFRKWTLGPELSAALDHAIGRLRPDEYGYKFGPLIEPYAIGVEHVR